MLGYDDQQQIELRSDEVQEILGTPPGWLVRWGTTVALIAFVALLLAGWMVRYPDVIPAKIVLTTANPPVEVVARTEGPIAQLFVVDKDTVRKGDELLVLQGTARYADVKQLDLSVAIWSRMPVDSLVYVETPTGLELGDVQSEYSAFLQQLESFRFAKGVKSVSVDDNIASINQQIQRLRQSIEFDRRSRQRAENQLASARELFSRQEELFQQGLISRVALEQERQKVADAERLQDAFDEGILRKQNEIINLRKNINEVSFSERQDDSSLRVRLQETLSALRNRIDQWKQDYLLTAPVDGRVSMNTAYFSAQQFVRKGEQVLTIVPPTTRAIIGRLTLEAAGSGKVKPGQRVVVKLQSYPYYEFGSLFGIIETKALVPKDEQYLITVSFPDKLVTNYRKVIPFEQQLQGDAEIITEDKRFLERIMEQVFAVGH